MKLAVGIGAGAILGAFYFGALWLTVRRVTEMRRPGVLVAGSFVARFAVLGGGLYLIVRLGGGGALVAALLALLAVRQLAIGSVRDDLRAASPGEDVKLKASGPWS